jgi:hypothetical protein
MKNLSTGTGLALLAAAIVAYPFASSLAPNANAVGIGTTAVTAVAAAATAQDPPAPTVVWMGVIGTDTEGKHRNFFRLWSDGRMEGRSISFPWTWNGSCLDVGFQSPCGDTGWVEIPAPPGGNGFACRTDLNGDRSVDGVDLGIMLAAWGPSAACNPDPTYACIGFGGGIAP